jgi:niacin transporter
MNIYFSLIGAMIVGRGVSFSVILIAINTFGMKLPLVFGTLAVFSAGIPGMIVQIILVPVLVFALRRFVHGYSNLSVE